MEETLLQKGCKIGVVPQVDYAVITSFPYKTFLSIYLAIWKCYPKLQDYCDSDNLCAHPWIEVSQRIYKLKVLNKTFEQVYSKNRIQFFAPLSRQDDFYLEPFTPSRDKE